jgi:translocation and assembly module TamA
MEPKGGFRRFTFGCIALSGMTCNNSAFKKPGVKVVRLGLRAKTGLVLALAAGLMGAVPQADAFQRLDFQTPGASKDLRGELLGASLLRTAERDKVTDPQDLFAAARAEYSRLLGALYARGHYSGVIHVFIDGREVANIAPLDAPTQIDRIEVIVEPGPEFTFSRADIAPLARDTVLPKGFAPGAVAGSGEIRQAVASGIEAWRDAGHAKATVAGQDLSADHASSTLSASVKLNPGQKLRFGKLAITGQDRMREARIRKIAGLPEGEVFSPRELARATERLRRTGIFKSVTLTEDDKVSPPDLLGISAAVVEEKLRRYRFGAEIASFDGVNLSGSWLHRNLLGGGERLEVKGDVTNIGAQSSGVDYKLGVTIDRPATLSPDTTARFHFEIAHLDEKDFNADTASTGLGFSQILTEQLSARAGLDYEYTQGKDSAGDFLYRNLSLPLGVIWDRRDSKTDAAKGFYIEAEVKPFYGFGTTDSGARLTFDTRAYRGIGEANGVIVAARVQAGAILGASLGGTPRDFLFYTGGGGTVRGQPYQSLGVTVLGPPGAEVKTGGTYFLAASAELRAKVTDKIGVVAFVDVGQVSVGGFNDASADWQAGAGLGLRYATGFGPIRLDVATPVGGSTGKGVQIYVGIGQAF